ncbi:MAG: metalloregulator ArsR/SmtB family transcription factor [Lentisphaerae bacterium]|nr:metalloregulator ArsR/SmtB family transcription factor [Lentisphaerota bacterium]
MRSTMRVTKALSDPQRVRILMMLRPGELCVCQIVEVLALAPSTVSKHLSILSGAALVDSRKEGRWAYYRISEGADGAFARPVLKWVADALRGDAAIAQDNKTLGRAVACDPETLTRRQRMRGK